MAQRTCTRPGCNKPHRARGLCASHYNQEHAPNRHKPQETPCVVCSTPVIRAGGGGRRLGATCSTTCRVRAKAILRGERTQLPADHWARWYGKTSAWPRFGFADCTWCGRKFVKRSPKGRLCSRTCTDREDKGVRMAMAETAATTRQCARCDAAYVSPYIGRIHCSDLCRELDRKARGVELFHGWISKAERLAIYERDDYTCQLCGEPTDPQADPQRGDWYPTLDHIVPRSQGGTHDANNLRTAHRWCNSIRGDRDELELFELTA